MTTPDWKSKCCNNKLNIHADVEGTSYFECGNCGKPCDIFLIPPEKPASKCEVRATPEKKGDCLYKDCIHSHDTPSAVESDTKTCKTFTESCYHHPACMKTLESDWEKEAEKIYFTEGMTIDDWTNFVKSEKSKSFQEGRENLLKELNITKFWNTKEIAEIKEAGRQEAHEEVRKKPEPPMGVSQWLAMGKKYGYVKYFEGKCVECFKEAVKGSFYCKKCHFKE